MFWEFLQNKEARDWFLSLKLWQICDSYLKPENGTQANWGLTPAAGNWVKWHANYIADD